MILLPATAGLTLRGHSCSHQELWDAKCFWTLTPKIHLLTTGHVKMWALKSLWDKCMIIPLPKTELFFSKNKHIGTTPSLCTACSDFKLIVFAFSHCWHHTKPECMQGRDGGEGRNLLRKDIIHWKTKWLMHSLGKNKLTRKKNYRATEFSLHNRKIVPLFCFPILWRDVQRENRHSLSNLPDLQETMRSLETW